MKKSLYLLILTAFAATSFASKVTNVELAYKDGETVARIDVSGQIRFTHQTEIPKDGKPDRVIIDVLTATHELGAKVFEDLPVCPVTAVRTSQYSVKPEAVVRLVFDLKRTPVYQVETQGQSIIVRIVDKTAAPFPAWSTSQALKPSPKAAPATAALPKAESPKPLATAATPVQKTASAESDRQSSLATNASKPALPSATPAPSGDKGIASATKPSAPAPSNSVSSPTPLTTASAPKPSTTTPTTTNEPAVAAPPTAVAVSPQPATKPADNKPMANTATAPVTAVPKSEIKPIESKPATPTTTIAPSSAPVATTPKANPPVTATKPPSPAASPASATKSGAKNDVIWAPPSTAKQVTPTPSASAPAVSVPASTAPKVESKPSEVKPSAVATTPSLPQNTPAVVTSPAPTTNTPAIKNDTKPVETKATTPATSSTAPPTPTVAVTQPAPSANIAKPTTAAPAPATTVGTPAMKTTPTPVASPSPNAAKAPSTTSPAPSTLPVVTTPAPTEKVSPSSSIAPKTPVNPTASIAKPTENPAPSALLPSEIAQKAKAPIKPVVKAEKPYSEDDDFMPEPEDLEPAEENPYVDHDSPAGAAWAEKDETVDSNSTARFRRHPLSAAKIKGTMIAQFPQRLVIKYETGGSRDPFATLIDDSRTFNSPTKQGVPNVDGMKLVGVIVARQGGNRALFLDKNGYSYMLKSGDKVRNGYVLRIESDRAYFQIFEYGWSRTIALKIDES